ncbi:pentatricopeptide repeat-containing protein At4g38150 isoform X3 [Ananas comosus]|uniref:Pentatricopeptide repeat-containing protein At4g38150 isoform X3 n=1 Tax=Ananas comosus TaxID=4615 RepID=A0A6P5EF24_ANACO|nr:pentatricopeptide repeat-containing protein At4g38150 isoform X3 [Ananas comosus]
MQATAAWKIFFSMQARAAWRRLSHAPKDWNFQSPWISPLLPRPLLPARVPPIVEFSTTPSRPMRGRGRRAGRDDGPSEEEEEEDFFLRTLNFGDDGGNERAREKNLADPQQGPPRPARRPPRGERRSDTPRDVEADDFFPHFQDGNEILLGGGRRSSSYRMPNRPPPAGERRGKAPGTLRHNLKAGDIDEDVYGDFEALLREEESPPPPPPPPRPPMRPKEAGKSDGAIKINDESDDPSTREKGGAGLGETLFQKLKLGDAAPGDKMEGETQRKSPANLSDTDSAATEPPPQDAEEVFKKMKETGLIPNAVAMLDGLCKDGLIQEAMKLFGLMREKGTIPEVVIYTAVVDGFCKAAKFDDAKRIFRKMQKNGIVPNAFSYAVLIQGLSNGGKLDESVEFCTEMFEAGHSPNATTFIGLVNGFCKEKGVEEAEKLVKSFRERNFIVDEKAVREHLDKKGPFSPLVWEAIFGKKISQRPF